MYEELLQSREFSDSELPLTFLQFLDLTEPITGFNSATFPLFATEKFKNEQMILHTA